MKRQFITFIFLLVFKILPAQEYETEVRKAEEDYGKERFDSCRLHFKKAFRIREGSGSDLYNAAVCSALNLDRNQAFKFLERAINKGINISKLRVDPDFTELQKTGRWKKLMKYAAKIQSDSFAKTLFPHYAKRLSDLWEADQYDRFRLARAYKAKDTILVNETWKKMKISDSLNLLQFQFILDEIGWPTISKVGKWGAATAFLVIDHAPREVMEKYFPLLETAAKNGEASISNYAIMKDRVLINRNQKQVYGTQKYWDETQKKFIFFPIADEKSVNKLRREAGLPELEEFK